MKKRTLLLSLTLIAVLALALAAPAFAQTDRVFRTQLSGAEEVPPVETAARGIAVFRLSQDGTELNYTLVVNGLADILQAHIHLASAGENGPVVAWLYPSAPPALLIPGTFNGLLARGTITADNLVGPLAGQPLSALIDAMRAGDTYANVHTTANPAGAIRGQID